VCERLERAPVRRLRPSPQSRPICPLSTSSPPSSSSRRSSSRLAPPHPIGAQAPRGRRGGAQNGGLLATSVGMFQCFFPLHRSGKVTRLLPAFQEGEGGYVGQAPASGTKGGGALLLEEIRCATLAGLQRAAATAAPTEVVVYFGGCCEGPWSLCC
jgi:hypothetical protein